MHNKIIVTLLSLILLISCTENDGVGPAEELIHIAFIYQPDSGHKNQTDFGTLLISRGYAFQAFTMDQITGADYSPFDLIIIDSWIGSGNDWGSIAQGNALLNTGLPILGLGFGGARFFGEIGLTISWDNGQYFPDSTSQSMLNTQLSIADGRINLMHDIFNTPVDITISDDTAISVYHHSGVIAADDDNSLADSVDFFGRRPEFPSQFTLASEGKRYFLWGFTNAPGSMTENGKNMFTNLVDYLAK